MSEPRIIEDDGRNFVTDISTKAIDDDDKLERLEKNLQKAKEMYEVGNEPIEKDTDDSNSKKQKKLTSRKKASSNEVEDSNIVYAPSIDEVTADNDHLANLRGEGRYFGVVDPDANEPVCSNCHRRGHKRAQCKVVVCHACGKVDDHYETQCPNSMVCSNCGEKGHFRNNCPSKRNYTYCVLCDSRNHISERCPTIWRSYVVKKIDPNSKLAYPSSRIFCYNCASKGHYGDDCRKPRISKTPNINGSAFSGENLPKSLILQYRNMLNRDSQYHDNQNNLKRKYDEVNKNYNYAPPPYKKFGRNNGNKNDSYNNNSNHYSSNNYNSNNNNNNNNSNNSHIPKGPKRGYIPSRNISQNQGRANNYNSSNKNNNHSTYRPSYFNNNNRGNGNKRSWN